MKLIIYTVIVASLLSLANAQPSGVPAPAAGASGGRGGRGAQAPLPFMINRFDPGLDLVISPDAKPETIVTIPALSGEGPMWREGRLWFSDQKAGGSI